MVQGPFRLRVSRLADQLDFFALSEAERKALFQGQSYKESEHDIYRFFVLPEIVLVDGKLPRKDRKKSYEKVDSLAVEARFASDEARLLGIFPTTRASTGQFEFSLQKLLFTMGKAAGFSLEGDLKQRVRRGKVEVASQHNDAVAQWFFSRKVLSEPGQLRLQVLCVIPKDTPDGRRYLQCVARAAAARREISRCRARVALPQPSPR